MAKCDVVVVVLVDADGNYSVGRDADEARANYTDQVGALEDTDGFRLVDVKLSVPCPAPVELSGNVPELEGIGALVVS